MSKGHFTTIVGGGLAGVEAAYQAAKLGINVLLYEMRPTNTTAAHKTQNLGELVCSNSFKSNSNENASGVLKEEMRMLGSIVVEAADRCRVPAGKALAVDRDEFSEFLTEQIKNNPRIEFIRREITEIPSPENGPVIIATGPLTSAPLAREIQRITGANHLYFYDSISPIIDAETIDHSKVFRASRYGYGGEGDGDYLNCPLNRDEYFNLVEQIIKAEKVQTWDFEKAIYFESCLPIEVMAQRGKDTLRFGPMKPVGLKDPATGKTPFAVVQLRAENKEGTMHNMVGLQTKLKYPEQRRIFRMIPGLESAEFLRFGSIHRNTYINSPKLLRPTLQLNAMDDILIAGQITGVEGYIESAAMGIIAGINASRILKGATPTVPPKETSIGALIGYITDQSIKNFQPMNINFGLYPPIPDGVPKSEKKRFIADRALAKIKEFELQG